MTLIKTLASQVLLLCTIFSNAQSLSPGLNDESNNSASGNANASDYAETLEAYRKHPININTANYGALYELHLLSSIQVNALMRHRELYGPLFSEYELQSIPGFDLETIRNILPYIRVDDAGKLTGKNIKSTFGGGQQFLVISMINPLQKPNGFLNGTDSNFTNDYLGNNFKTNIRYRYTKGSKLSIGFNADNDIGEPFFNKNQKKGYDFYSGHFYFQNSGFVKQVAIGDYHVSIGQGLGIGSGFVINKSIEVLQVHRYASGLKPYRSLNEFGFFRGAAATFGTTKLSVMLFVSVKKTDGNILLSDSTLFSEDRYYNLIQTGNHRTTKELLLKNTSRQSIYGGYVTTQQKRFQAGAGYNLLKANGTSAIWHCDFNYNGGNYSLFGEGSLQQHHGKAVVAGYMASIHRNADIAIIYRKYDYDFENLLSNAFSNASTPSNENGIYATTNIKLNKQFRLLCYADLFNSPKPGYRKNGATFGSDYAAALQYQPSKAFKLEVRFRNYNSENNIPSSLNHTVSYLTNTNKSTVRCQADYAFSKQLTLRTRLEQSSSNGENIAVQKGNMLFQDVHYRTENNSIGIHLRYCLFKSNGTNVRIYAFENDIPYSFSISQLSGNGVQYYIMFHVKIKHKAELWFRYSKAIFPDASALGSGLDKIEGNTKEMIKLLLKIPL